MESSCVRQTVLPGVSKLFDDYLYNFDRVRDFYSSHFSDGEALVNAAERIRFPETRRGRLVSALREQNGDSSTLSKLAESGTVAVVTGQQVGLFSGPAYTIFKALTAVRLAEHLTELGTPAVPIFWLATEDHDLAEIDHAWVFDQQARPSRIAISDRIANGIPVGSIKLGEVPLAALRSALGDLPFAQEVVRRVASAYHPEASFGSAFRTFLQDVLKDCGLLYVDPLLPSIREIAADFLSETVDRAPDLLAALRQRNRDLIAAGYHAQVHIDDNASLLFLMNGKRVPVRWKDGRFITRDRSFTAPELHSQAERISPNALLRPVMQDYLLPTVSYVGGPSEIAYMAQSQVLYENLLGRMPVLFPRNSFTLLDARAKKLLQRYDLCVPDLLDNKEKVSSRIAARLVPSGLNDKFASLRSGMSSSLDKLGSDLAGFDPTLETAAKKSMAKILYQVDKLSRKTARETMRRDERATKDAAYLMDLIYPHRHLQERFYSIVPFLAKHGFDLPQRLFGQTQLACPDHMIRVI